MRPSFNEKKSKKIGFFCPSSFSILDLNDDQRSFLKLGPDDQALSVSFRRKKKSYIDEFSKAIIQRTIYGPNLN